jgi:hypothetical protein
MLTRRAGYEEIKVWYSLKLYIQRSMYCTLFCIIYDAKYTIVTIVTALRKMCPVLHLRQEMALRKVLHSVGSRHCWQLQSKLQLSLGQQLGINMLQQAMTP